MSIYKDDRIYITPSGVQKERLGEEDIFVLDESGEILSRPDAIDIKVSASTPIFLSVFHVRGAGAIIHSHSVNAVLATMIANETFEVTHLEMMKGIAGIHYHDRLIVPIVENTAREADLADPVAEMMEKYPESHAVLVRRHGIYVWGKSWEQAKIHTECYDHIFSMVTGMRQLGIDPTETASMRS